MGMMMRCPKCGLGFEDQYGIVASPGTTITATSTRISCPRPGCSGTARQVQEGTFRVSASGTWNLLREALTPADTTVQDYQELFQTLLVAQREHAPPEEVVQRISSQVPKFAALGNLLLSQKGGALA